MSYVLDTPNINRASQVALVVKNLLASAEDLRDLDSIPGLGRSPGGRYGNPLCILAWRIPQIEEPGRLQSIGLQRVRHNLSNLVRMQPDIRPQVLACILT